jgi:hypothetical protein
MITTVKLITQTEYQALLADNAALQIDHDGDEVLIVCPICAGDGKDPDGDAGCGCCAGTGIGRGDPDTSRCGCCKGSGRASRHDPPCPTCDGAGFRYIELSQGLIDRLRSEAKLLTVEPRRAYVSASDSAEDYCPW